MTPIALGSVHLIRHHETGHALYNSGYISPIDISKEKYLDHNVMAALKDEGEATITNITVRQEILNNNGPDIGIGGTQSAKYVEVYNDVYAKEGDRDKARHEIGKVFAKNEKPSTTPDKTYEEYYGDSFSNIYEKHNKKPGNK